MRVEGGSVFLFSYRESSMRIFVFAVMVLFGVLSAAAVIAGLVALFSGNIAFGLGALVIAIVLIFMTRSVMKSWRQTA